MNKKELENKINQLIKKIDGEILALESKINNIKKNHIVEKKGRFTITSYQPTFDESQYSRDLTVLESIKKNLQHYDFKKNNDIINTLEKFKDLLKMDDSINALITDIRKYQNIKQYFNIIESDNADITPNTVIYMVLSSDDKFSLFALENEMIKKLSFCPSTRKEVAYQIPNENILNNENFFNNDGTLSTKSYSLEWLEKELNIEKSKLITLNFNPDIKKQNVNDWVTDVIADYQNNQNILMDEDNFSDDFDDEHHSSHTQEIIDIFLTAEEENVNSNDNNNEENISQITSEEIDMGFGQSPEVITAEVIQILNNMGHPYSDQDNINTLNNNPLLSNEYGKICYELDFKNIRLSKPMLQALNQNIDNVEIIHDALFYTFSDIYFLSQENVNKLFKNLENINQVINIYNERNANNPNWERDERKQELLRILDHFSNNKNMPNPFFDYNEGSNSHSVSLVSPEKVF